MKFRKTLVTGLTAMCILLAGCASDTSDNNSSSSSANTTSSNTTSSSHSTSDNVKTTPAKKHSTKKHTTNQPSNSANQSLANLDYQNNTSAVINVNNGLSTLKTSDWKYNHVDYTNLDSLNRTSTGNTAYLESRNVANDSLRTRQTVQPTGWHQKFYNREAIINRGHEIAYSLSKGISTDGSYSPNDQSGDQNNLKNLFTQTAFSNQKLQTIYESKVRNALRNNEKVIYQVQPIFRGNELMARGVHIQAISTDGTLNFNVYIFNVQPHFVFNYSDGTSRQDDSFQVPTPADAPSFGHTNSYSENTGATTHRTYHHHYVRDALIAGAVHHYIRKHYERKYSYPYHHYTTHRHYSYRRHY
jgi:DNA-entry nuclease